MDISNSFGFFTPDWKKESAYFLKRELERKATQLEGARMILGIVESSVVDLQREIADITDALLLKTMEQEDRNEQE